MANATTQPIRLTNFMVYNSSKQVLGVATATLPSIEAQTDTITGAGIAGEIDMPTLGHYGSITVSLSFRSLTAEAVELAKAFGSENSSKFINGVLGTAYKQLGIVEEKNESRNKSVEGATGAEGTESAGSVADGKD